MRRNEYGNELAAWRLKRQARRLAEEAAADLLGTSRSAAPNKLSSFWRRLLKLGGRRPPA